MFDLDSAVEQLFSVLGNAKYSKNEQKDDLKDLKQIPSAKLTEKEINDILKLIKEKHGGGQDAVFKELHKEYKGPKAPIVNDLLMAYKKYKNKAGFDALVAYLEDLKESKEDAAKSLSENPVFLKLPKNIEEIRIPAKKALEAIEKLEKHGKDPFFSYTTKLLELLLSYLKNGEKVPAFEQLFTEVFYGSLAADEESVMKQWSYLKCPEVYDRLKEFKEHVRHMFPKHKTYEKRPLLEKEKELSKGKGERVEDSGEKSTYYRQLRSLANRPMLVTTFTKELVKEINKKDNEKIKEISQKVELTEEEQKEWDKSFKEKNKTKEKEDDEKRKEKLKERIKELKKKYKSEGKSKEEIEELVKRDIIKERQEERKKERMDIKERRDIDLKEKEETEKKEKEKEEKRQKDYLERLNDAKRNKEIREKERKEKEEKERAEKKKERELREKGEGTKKSNLSLFTKIENLRDRSGNKLAYAELDSILNMLKTVL